MTLAPWRSILGRSLHRNRALIYAKYFQLATVRPNGRPANRTVVFRGFLPQSNAIAIITDQRSSKIEQIEHNGWAEICWYFPKTREQFRFAGQVHIVDATHPIQSWQKAFYETWQALSEAARTQFYGVAPGQPRTAEQIESEFKNAPNDIPESFRLLVFEPQDLDYLNLTTHPHDHYHYWQDEAEQWRREWLTP